MRTGLRSAWTVARWPLFGLAVVAAVVLGFIGFDRYYAGLPVDRGTSDLVYLTLQLFVLESGSVPDSGAPWQLEVARLLAPATTGIAIGVALMAAFREEIDEVRLRLMRGHVVVCGIGGRGSRLAHSLLDGGHRVVAVDRDGANPALPDLRRRGASVVFGDARALDTLRRAGVRRAAKVVALAGDDDVNADVAIHAAELAPERGPALVCLAHVHEAGLCTLLCAEELAGRRGANFRIEFFNIYEQGARALLHDHEAVRGATAPRLAVVGAGRLGRAVIVEAARQWREHAEGRGTPIHVTVVDPVAAEIVDRLLRRHPRLGAVADLEVIEARFDDLDGRVLAGGERLRAVFVCVDHAPAALEAGLQIRRCLADRSIPVVIELGESAGLARLVEREGQAGLHAFDLFERTLRPDLLLGGTYEILARAIHAEYVEAQCRLGVTAADNPAVVAWELLPDSLKESNRDQAADIGVKLAAVGCGVGPLSEWDAGRLVFSESEVEWLAELEHRRWVAQRRRDGWTDGPKDLASGTSPYLIPWDELDDEIKEWDRRAVRGIPRFLARAGFQVVRGSHDA